MLELLNLQQYFTIVRFVHALSLRVYTCITVVYFMARYTSTNMSKSARMMAFAVSHESLQTQWLLSSAFLRLHTEHYMISLHRTRCMTYAM
jgi:hypothetical protein